MIQTTLILKLIELAIDIAAKVIEEDKEGSKQEKIEQMRNMRKKLDEIKWELEK